MTDRNIISLNHAQMAAERFLEDPLKNIKTLSVDKVKLGSIEGILIYEVAGIARIGIGLIRKKTDFPFKVQVAATDGTIVGYETQIKES